MASFKSFLSAIGHDAVTVFKWLGSTQGQTEVQVVEGAAAAVTSAVNPAAGLALTGIEALINAGLKQVVSIETVSVEAGQQSGSGAQKASAVASAAAPQIQATLQALGVPNPTAAQIQSIGSVVATSLANIVNAFPPPATPAPAPAAPAEPAPATT